MATHNYHRVSNIIKWRWLSNNQKSTLMTLAILSIVLINLQQTKCCGDSGPAGIIAERDLVETPLSPSPNVRSLMRRSTGHKSKRKACGTSGNSQKFPPTR
jgi:hypothetical protein